MTGSHHRYGTDNEHPIALGCSDARRLNGRALVVLVLKPCTTLLYLFVQLANACGARSDVALVLIQPTCRGGLVNVKKTLDIPRLQGRSCKSGVLGRMFRSERGHAPETTTPLEDLCSLRQI